MNCLIKFVIRLNILSGKKVLLQIVFNHNFGELRIDSYNSLPIEKILTFHYVIIHIKSVVNKHKNEYYYNIFLERGSHKYKFDTRYF